MLAYRSWSKRPVDPANRAAQEEHPMISHEYLVTSQRWSQ